MTSLREELGVAPDPDFALVLPNGWARFGVDERAEQQMRERVRDAAMAANRPDTYAVVRAESRQAFGALREQSVHAFFAPDGSQDGALLLPASITASFIGPPAGATMDAWVASLIAEHGAEPLNGDPRFVRFERSQTQSDPQTTVRITSAVYLTPVPGTARRRALRFVASLGHDVLLDRNDPWLESVMQLFDSVVASLRWEPAGV